jgi:hypothetical protein
LPHECRSPASIRPTCQWRRERGGASECKHLCFYMACSLFWRRDFPPNLLFVYAARVWFFSLSSRFGVTAFLPELPMFIQVSANFLSSFWYLILNLVRANRTVPSFADICEDGGFAECCGSQKRVYCLGGAVYTPHFCAI